MRAFTTIELVMVIIVLGILSSIGSYTLRDNSLYSQSNKIYLELKLLRLEALNGAKSCTKIENKFLAKSYDICFNNWGQALHNGELITTNMHLNFRDKNKNKSITIYNMTGYVIIK